MYGFGAQEKRTFYMGGNRIEVDVYVVGMHSYQPLNSDSLNPPMTDLLRFAVADTAQPVNVHAGFKGTISFFVKLAYQFFPSTGGSISQTIKWVAMAGGPPISFGRKLYRYSFDYVLPLAAANATDLTIQSPSAVGVMVEDPVVEGDDDKTVEINVWNGDSGMAKGPNYVRINPVVAIPQSSVSNTTSAGFKGFGGQQTTSNTPPLPGNAIGEFTVPIHTQLIPGPIADNKPSLEFVKDMAVGWTYANDNEYIFTPGMQDFLTTHWMKNIDNKYPTVGEAIHKGKLTATVGGYASITGTPSYNQKLSTARLDPVVAYLNRYLGVPKTYSVPYGSQFAHPYWEFHANGSVKIVSQPEDRKVIVSIDPNEAWKTFKDGV